MADEIQVKLLRQGVFDWNAWRRGLKLGAIDLRGANLAEADLGAANLRDADLSKANLRDADLSKADLRDADLSKADLSRANLVRANLSGADLSGADLSEAGLVSSDLGRAKLSRADLSWADLVRAELGGADLSRADLSGANLSGAGLRGANLQGARLNQTVLGNVDLSAVTGVETCRHNGPSIIDFRTLQCSGALPLPFLRGVGLPDLLIEYLPSLLNQPIQMYSCFISYSNQEFAERLHADLQNKGVRCWFAPHDLPIGAKTWDAIDQAIKLRDKLLLILSQNAIASDWVEDEVNKAFAEEWDRKQLVLFPVRIDETVMETPEPWARKLRDTRNIGDFRKWKDHDAYHKGLERLLRDPHSAKGRALTVAPTGGRREQYAAVIVP